MQSSHPTGSHFLDFNVEGKRRCINHHFAFRCAACPFPGAVMYCHIPHNLLRYCSISCCIIIVFFPEALIPTWTEVVMRRWQKLLSLCTQEHLQYKTEHLYHSGNYYVVLIFPGMHIKQDTSNRSPSQPIFSQNHPSHLSNWNFKCLWAFLFPLPGCASPHPSTPNWSILELMTEHFQAKEKWERSVYGTEKSIIN